MGDSEAKAAEMVGALPDDGNRSTPVRSSENLSIYDFSQVSYWSVFFS